MCIFTVSLEGEEEADGVGAWEPGWEQWGMGTSQHACDLSIKGSDSQEL